MGTAEHRRAEDQGPRAPDTVAGRSRDCFVSREIKLAVFDERDRLKKTL